MQEDLVQTAEQSNVVLSAALTKDCIAGEPVNLVLLLKNKGKEDVFYADSSEYRDYRIEVYDAKKEKVPMTRFGTRFIGASPGERWRCIYKKLAPGEQIRSVVNLARLFDLTIADEYTISITRIVNENQPDKEIKLEVRGVPFTISDAPNKKGAQSGPP